MPTTHYIWDPMRDNVLMEADGNGGTTAVYTSEQGHFGKLICQRRNGQSYYHHYDAVGSTRSVTDQNQNVVETAAYTAFGETVAKTSSITNPFGYKGALGYYANSETNDLYVRARTLTPTLPRWLSLDVLIFVDGTNRYCYASNNPLTKSDPSGLKSISDCLATGNESECNGCCAEVPSSDQVECLLQCKHVLPTLPHCTLEICCSSVLTIFSSAHCVIRFTDFPSGNISGCRGGPSATGTGSAAGKGGQPEFCDCCGGFGSVITACGTGSANSNDRAEIGLDSDLRNAKQGGCTPVALKGTCLTVKSCIEREMTKIEKECWTYDPTWNNSNTTWRTAMQRCTGSIPDIPGLQPGNETFDSPVSTPRGVRRKCYKPK
jgi:RHS repeat-associated protein